VSDYILAELTNLGNGLAAHGDMLGTDIVRQAIQEINRLAAIVEKLPDTADGVPVVPGVDKVWRIWPDGIAHPEVTVTCDAMCGWRVRWGEIGTAYSTREAAEAAKAKGDGE
jgi:hypothetical protein